MRRAARRAAVLLVVPVAVLVAVLVAVVGAGAPARAADDAGRYAADRVLVVGVPGLAWSDLAPGTTPQLWDLADGGAIGALSVRAARSPTCVLDGWATLGAGNRASLPGSDEPIPPVPLPGGEDGGQPPAVDASLAHCDLQEQVAGIGLTDPAAAVEQIAADEATARFGAEPGALGAAVGCASVVGRAATVAVAADGVPVATQNRLPGDPAALAELLTGCPLTAISLDQLTDAGRPGPEWTDTGTEPAARAAALGTVDAAVGRLRAAVAGLPGRTLVLLLGVSEVNNGRPRLHVAIASGPGFGAGGWLTSASTGRAPFAQLIDVAPTALRALGATRPASMNGQPLQATGTRPPPAAAVAELDRVDIEATAHYRSTGVFFWLLVALNAVAVGFGLRTLGSRRPGRGPRAVADRPRRALRALALAAASLPAATNLAGLVPWERAGSPRWALAGAVLAADLLVLAVAGLGPWRRRPFGPPLAVLAVTVATVVGDVLTGSRLELDGLLGYDAIVAGRFTGYGNLTFGLLATGALLLTAAAATAVGRRAHPGRDRAAAAGTVLGVAVVTVGLIGAPQLGRDFGGVLAALPGFLLLAMLLSRTRVTVVRLAAILAAAVVAVGTLAVLDWLRPADERTHLGRFVDQLLTGEAWTVVSRKAAANLGVLVGSPLAWMLPVAAVAAWWLVRRGGLLRGGVVGPQAPVLRAGLLAVALSLALGAAVNDSGIAVPATAAALLVPLLVWLAAAPPRAGAEDADATGGTSGSEPVAGADRVTVVSRGSTVWHA